MINRVGPEPETEPVLLCPPSEGDPILVVVPRGARRHAVPHRAGISRRVRGLVFDRTDDRDRSGLPVFRVRGRRP